MSIFVELFGLQLLPSKEMDTTTRVQNPDEVCVSHSTNNREKGLIPVILSVAMA